MPFCVSARAPPGHPENDPRSNLGSFLVELRTLKTLEVLEVAARSSPLKQ
jgi:hypothetical protein